jgi:hypothetical protein
MTLILNINFDMIKQKNKLKKWKRSHPLRGILVKKYGNLEVEGEQYTFVYSYQLRRKR